MLRNTMSRFVRHIHIFEAWNLNLEDMLRNSFSTNKKYNAAAQHRRILGSSALAEIGILGHASGQQYADGRYNDQQRPDSASSAVDPEGKREPMSISHYSTARRNRQKKRSREQE